MLSSHHKRPDPLRYQDPEQHQRRRLRLLLPCEAVRTQCYRGVRQPLLHGLNHCPLLRRCLDRVRAHDNQVGGGDDDIGVLRELAQVRLESLSTIARVRDG